MKSLLFLKQGHDEMNHEFVCWFRDLLYSPKATLLKELKRDPFVNAFRPEVHVEVLKMGVTTCDFAIARCLALEAIEIQDRLKKPLKPSQ